MRRKRQAGVTRAPISPKDVREPIPKFSDYFVDLKWAQRERFFLQFGTPCRQDSVPSFLCVPDFDGNFPYGWFPRFEIHRQAARMIIVASTVWRTS